MRDYLEAILTARVYDVAMQSPLELAPLLSASLGNSLLLKREDLQPVHSFKLRGAFNKLSTLPPIKLRRGVITASAGNHAQGVALAAQQLGTPAVIVMPETTARIKVDAVARLGATIVSAGDSYAEAEQEALRLARSRRLAFVHAYDDPDVIAGQGTVGMEIHRQARDRVHAVFVPVGGGGLISGIAAYLKRLCPDTRIIGVEPVDANAMQRSLRAGRRITLARAGQFADGVAVRRVGKEPFRLVRQHVDQILTIDTDETCAAIKDVYEDTRAIIEPSAALAVAGARSYAQSMRLQRQTLVAVISGANVNFDRLRFISERADIGERREAILAATIPERRGSFKAFCQLIGKRKITEFNYRYADPTNAFVYVGVEIGDQTETSRLLATLHKAGIPTLDLTDNEMAKLHIRHLVGGRAEVAHELLYRFEFPECPGALLTLLNALTDTWNISLFHYRNHGADYGRVLAGIQVPPPDRPAFREKFRRLGYAFYDETQNPAAEAFLRG